MGSIAPPNLEVAYVSGPMTKADNHGYPAFIKVAQRLRGKGLFVLNPAEGGPSEAEVLRHADEHRTKDFRETPMYAKLMTRDIGFVLMSDMLFMLPGWNDSRGAQMEHNVAVICGKDIVYLENDADWAWLLDA